MKSRLSLLLVIGLLFSQPAWAAEYKLGKEHTTVGFKIRHLFSWVQGTFNEFDGQFTYDPDKPETWKVDAVIQAKSIDTHNEKRDTHLSSADFFDVEKFPTLSFKSTGVHDATKSNAKLDGILTLHGVEKPVTLDLEIHGAGKDPWGNMLSGFTATTKINRKDFGLSWNQSVETGQLLVGEEVLITIEVEGVLLEETK
ncbi:MAG: polyisoprenoid-binding protein [Candidatus Omnitrophica bacterium]|nr:polyisoprenoid-binding protein [Candidatus Omnitrophota bacterium]